MKGSATKRRRVLQAERARRTGREKRVPAEAAGGRQWNCGDRHEQRKSHYREKGQENISRRWTGRGRGNQDRCKSKQDQQEKRRLHAGPPHPLENSPGRVQCQIAGRSPPREKCVAAVDSGRVGPPVRSSEIRTGRAGWLWAHRGGKRVAAGGRGKARRLRDTDCRRARTWPRSEGQSG